MEIYDAAPPLELALKDVVESIRKVLDDYDIPNMQFEISVSGRTQGDLKIEYELSELYGTNSVKGRSAIVVLDEFLRRRGWNIRNAPLSLSYCGEQVAAE